MTTQELSKQWSEITLIKCFEIEVVNKASNEQDYIIFDIALEDNEFIANHVALTKEEQNSDKIAFESIEIDLDFSIDQHLESLFDACQLAVISSDFYNLAL